MAQALSDILQELDASYAPSRQLINQQIDALPSQEQAQTQGLQAQQDQAFGDIMNGARDRGIGFSGIPLAEQAKYTGGTFLPAVANLKSSMATQKTSLLGALNNSNIDQQKTAFGIQQTQQAQDFQKQQADRAAAAAAASSQQLAGLFGGGQQPPTPAPVAPADPYGKIDKNAAQSSVAALLKTNDVGRINQEYNAIKKSAGYGNTFDQYKLGLITAAMQPTQTTAYNPAVANLVKSAISYKAPAPSKSTSDKVGLLANPYAWLGY